MIFVVNSIYPFYSLSPAGLRVHKELVHQQQVVFECHLCKFSCYRKDNLSSHIKVVHEKYRPLKCDLCEMSFYYKRDKIKHLAKIHEIEENSDQPILDS